MRIIALLFFLLLTSCVQKFPIYYNTSYIKPITKEPIPISVNIGVFTDLRKENVENDILFSNYNPLFIDDEMYCINSEFQYNRGAVAYNLSKQMAEHFGKAGIFKTTVFNRKEVADYTLVGAINQFYGVQHYDKEFDEILSDTEQDARVLVSTFNYAAESLNKNYSVRYSVFYSSPVVFYYDISDLKLIDKNGNVVMELGGFEKKYVIKYPLDTNCSYIYLHVNNQLRIFIDEILYIIYKDISESKFWEK
jgi:hypothetical protein